MSVFTAACHRCVSVWIAAAKQPPRYGFCVRRRAELSELSGKPGFHDFVTGLEQMLDRPIARRSPGRKPVVAAKGKQLYPEHGS
jgi:hypothetical protein